MKATGPYVISIIAADGTFLSVSESETLKDARWQAKHAIREPEYLDAGMVRVRIHDAAEICIFDQST